MIVGTVHEKLVEALRVQLSRSHSCDCQQVLDCVFARITDLRQICYGQRREVCNFAANWQHLQLPPLFAEMYDFPKWEDTGSVGNL